MTLQELSTMLTGLTVYIRYKEKQKDEKEFIRKMISSMVCDIPKLPKSLLCKKVLRINFSEMIFAKNNQTLMNQIVIELE